MLRPVLASEFMLGAITRHGLVSPSGAVASIFPPTAIEGWPLRGLLKDDL